MRTGRSLTICRSLLLGGGGMPGSDPPQFPPLVWAWIWSPSISPLGVGLYLIPLNFPLGCGPRSDPPQFPPWVWAWRGVPPSWGVSLEGVPLGVPPSWGSPWRGCLLLGGSLWRGCLPLGGSPWRGCLLLGGVSLAGGWYPSMHWGRPPLWTESHTAVKTLPWPQLRCGR